MLQDNLCSVFLPPSGGSRDLGGETGCALTQWPLCCPWNGIIPPHTLPLPLEKSKIQSPGVRIRDAISLLLLTGRGTEVQTRIGTCPTSHSELVPKQSLRLYTQIPCSLETSMPVKIVPFGGGTSTQNITRGMAPTDAPNTTMSHQQL